jgi:hypothetical protein
MNYALIADGLVVNIISLNPANAAEFPASVPLGDRPVGIGDTYQNGVFSRDGEPVLTYAERLEAEVAEYDAALTEIANALGVNVV